MCNDSDIPIDVEAFTIIGTARTSIAIEGSCLSIILVNFNLSQGVPVSIDGCNLVMLSGNLPIMDRLSRPQLFIVGSFSECNWSRFSGAWDEWPLAAKHPQK
jgi:hypothetical protein